MPENQSGLFFEAKGAHSFRKDESPNKILEFDPKAMKLNMEKIKADPTYNIWGFPLGDVSNPRHVMYMMSFQENLPTVNKQFKDLPPVFTEAVCTTLHHCWDSPKISELALVNIAAMIELSTDSVRSEMIDQKMIFCAVLSVCLQGEYIEYTRTFDEITERVLRIFYLLIQRFPGQSDVIDSRLIEAFLYLVPYAVKHMKNKDCTEGFYLLLRNIIVNIDFFYNTDSLKKACEWLSKHGVSSSVFAFIGKFSLKNYSSLIKIHVHFKNMIDIACRLKEGVKHKDIYSIIPNILGFLNLEELHPLRGDSVAAYTKTVHSIRQIILYVVSGLTIDGAKNLLTATNYFEAICNAMSNHQQNEEVLEVLQECFFHSLSGAVSVVMDPSQPNDNSELRVSCIHILKNICTKLRAFISSPTWRVRTSFSYVFYHCAKLLNRHSETALKDPGDDSLLGMMIAIAVMFDINHSRKIESAGSGLIVDYGSSRHNCLLHFYAVVELVAFRRGAEDQEIGLKLSKIVKNDLPELVTDYVTIGDHIYSERFAETLIRVALFYFDNVDDFFTPRWGDFHIMMLQYYVRATAVQKMNGNIDSTKLLLMWRVLQMDEEETLVSNILQIEVDLRKCVCAEVNLGTYKEIDHECDDHPTKPYNSENVIEEKKLEYFHYLIRDLKSVLKNITVLTYHDIKWAIFIMIELAKDFKDPKYVKMLKDLVFCALDFVADQNEEKFEKDVNNFIIHLYMTSS